MSHREVLYTHLMSKRLQVLFEESELEGIRRAAERQDMTVSEWVRTATREARRRTPSASKEAKLAVIRHACVHDFPTADIAQMLREIERGYSSHS